MDVSHITEYIFVKCQINISNCFCRSLEGKNKKIPRYTEFLELESYRTDESERPGPSVSIGELLGFEGSFGKLDVD